MADYAWSKIVYGVELNDDKSKKGDLFASPGDEVSASKLNLSEEDYQELKDIGAVRDYPFPEILQDPLQSPTQLIAKGLANSETIAATVGVSPELVDAYGKMQAKLQTPTEKEIDSETGKAKDVTGPPKPNS